MLRTTIPLEFATGSDTPNKVYPAGTPATQADPGRQSAAFRDGWERYLAKRRKGSPLYAGEEDVAVIIDGKARRVPAEAVEWVR